MRRSSFLKRSLGLVAGIAVGSRLPLEPVAGAVAEAPIAVPVGASFVANGGLCAPLTPYYDLAMLTTSARPVRDALPSFTAQRGGLRGE